MSQAVRQGKNTINEKDYMIEQLNIEVNRLKEMVKMNNSNTTVQTTAGDDTRINVNMDKQYFDTNWAAKHATQEWVDILKNIKITNYDLEALYGCPAFCKIIDAIDMLNKIVTDKNMQIKSKISDNENLIKKNSALIEENLKLSKNLTIAKSEISNNCDYLPEYTDISMVNYF